jgi:iron-sulfur cluster assembly protein
LSLKPSGCAGYSYVFEEAPSQHGDVLQEFPGFLLALPLSELSKLTGLVIDCETGLAGTRMTFHNPHETARCGCGLSVELKEHCA